MTKEIASNIFDLNLSLREKETEIELLQQTFTEIGSELDLDKIFQLVSTRARELIHAETVLVPLIDVDFKTYTYRGGAGANVEEIVGESLPLDHGVCGWVFKHQCPWWQGTLEELSEDERNEWGTSVDNMILVPLQGKYRFLGGIAGLNKQGGDGFDKKDLNLLQLFASIVSVAIENAMAMKSMEESHELNEAYRVKLETLNKQLVESCQELEYLSLYDTVTALPNRSLFHDRLSRVMTDAQSNGGEISLLLIDLDNFKDINEALGHDQGDRLLNRIARRFEKVIKKDETLARLGGDEFIVVLPNHDRAQALKRAGQFIESLRVAFSIQQSSIVVTANIGIALYPEHSGAISNLLSHADFAMHQAKKSDESVCIYNPDDDHYAQGQFAMIADVRKAMEGKEFELYYQPKVCAANGRLVAAEALGRWRCVSRGDVSPTIFIQVLEQSGLIHEYTYWAIETALTLAKECRECFGHLRIAVNLSPQTLMHTDFKSKVDQLVKDKSDGDLLTFEITENLFLSEFDRLSEVLDHICALGIELSIDDYGTGYSSLSRLRRLPVSELKIDKSFIENMVENIDDEVVVRSTIELAHNLGLSIVAEGVETQRAFDLLKALDCDIIQGDLIGKPLPKDEFKVFMQENSVSQIR